MPVRVVGLLLVIEPVRVVWSIQIVLPIRVVGRIRVSWLVRVIAGNWPLRGARVWDSELSFEVQGLKPKRILNQGGSVFAIVEHSIQASLARLGEKSSLRMGSRYARRASPLLLLKTRCIQERQASKCRLSEIVRELRVLSATSHPGEGFMDFERISVSLKRDDLA
ncbi:hypothetical protein DEO72_LG9g1099 [Vigna unguiculata]|uniref:Uncharacterized protein n=1 Tax=Vigna unguiculata TaxID=3917 RepID=A0A4D6MYH3_VIGUN|nr:hypothetical protein DEO72_LG9g1099 [Vigna unguiculata]